MTFFKWSTTAANNGTADSTCTWPEGMAASSANDSARGNMAALAKYRDDVSGSLTTGGSSTAYTVTSNQGFGSLTDMDNAVIAFVPHTTSGSAPTLAVDGLTAKKIRMTTGIDMPDGVLVSGTPYVVTYENGVGEFLLHNFAGNPWLIPLGVAMPFFGTTSPNSSLVLPYGQAISRTTYSTLFSMFGTTFGSGDGSTTFNIPDLRGRVIAGKDDMGSTSANRLTDQTGGLNGDTLGATGGSETHTLTTAQMPSHSHTVTDPGHTHATSSANLIAGTSTAQFTAGGTTTAPASAANLQVAVTGSSTTGISLSSTGSGGAHNNVQPTIIGNYLMRII